jgi:hypothetical protein
VSRSTIVRLFSCYTERNVNQCILNGSVFQTRERKRVRRQHSLTPRMSNTDCWQGHFSIGRWRERYPSAVLYTPILTWLHL